MHGPVPHTSVFSKTLSVHAMICSNGEFMVSRNPTIELDPLTAQALADYAAGLGLSVPEFLRRQFASPNGTSAIYDIDGWLDSLTEGSERYPPLPDDFSTKDIYADHD